MQRVRDGDLAALGDLFERHHRRLYLFLARSVGDAAAAEDLVQEVFVRILSYRRTYDETHRFETWLYRIARNARVDHFRRRGPEPDRVDAAFEVPAAGQGPADLLEREMDLRQLARAMSQLDEDRRDLLVLARYQAMPYDRIAELLGIEIGAVKVRVHRALKQLRAAFVKLERVDWAAKE
ncbi:MAG: RNA polymerase sigma factor [Vicinamibacterales bacterium]